MADAQRHELSHRPSLESGIGRYKNTKLTEVAGGWAAVHPVFGQDRTVTVKTTLHMDNRLGIIWDPIFVNWTTMLRGVFHFVLALISTEYSVVSIKRPYLFADHWIFFGKIVKGP